MLRLASILALALLAASPLCAQQTLQRTYAGRSCRVYVPSSYTPTHPRPLVVLLHGCTQDPADFARGNAFDAIAEREGLLVLYPAQPSSANQNQCWNWFEAAHQRRGAGEPASIVACVEGVARELNVDRERVYAAGLSAGAAMSSILGATYPDVFAAIGVHSGLEYAAATDVGSAFSAMFTGGPNPEQAAAQALRAMGPRRRALPVFVAHGTSDFTVRPINGEQTVAQWAQVADLALDGVDNDDVSARPSAQRQGTSAGGQRYTVFDHQTPDGTVLLRHLVVEGMGHAWAGGSTAGSYTDPAGPSASEALWAFFALHRRSGAAPTQPSPSPSGPSDTTAPTTVAAPPAGDFTGPVDVELVADERATTYYTLDGQDPTPSSAIYRGPLRVSQTSSLRFFSVDAAGNREPVRRADYRIGAGPAPCACAVQVERLPALTADSRARYVALDGLTAGELKVGDDGKFQSDLFRGFLAFDASNLPAGAQVQGATLRLRRRAASGDVTGLRIDLQRGYFGGAPSLARDDFNAPASDGDLLAAGPGADGDWLEVELPQAALDALSARGRVELRLRAETARPQFTPSWVAFVSSGADAPQLVLRLSGSRP